MKCKHCHKPLVETDFSYYCDNKNCSQYDVDIIAYEIEDNDTIGLNWNRVFEES